MEEGNFSDALLDKIGVGNSNAYKQLQNIFEYGKIATVKALE